jgi:hypothetical protein
LAVFKKLHTVAVARVVHGERIAVDGGRLEVSVPPLGDRRAEDRLNLSSRHAAREDADRLGDRVAAKVDDGLLRVRWTKREVRVAVGRARTVSGRALHPHCLPHGGPPKVYGVNELRLERHSAG